MSVDPRYKEALRCQKALNAAIEVTPIKWYYFLTEYAIFCDQELYIPLGFPDLESYLAKYPAIREHLSWKESLTVEAQELNLEIRRLAQLRNSDWYLLGEHLDLMESGKLYGLLGYKSFRAYLFSGKEEEGTENPIYIRTAYNFLSIWRSPYREQLKNLPHSISLQLIQMNLTEPEMLSAIEKLEKSDGSTRKIILTETRIPSQNLSIKALEARKQELKQELAIVEQQLKQAKQKVEPVAKKTKA